MPIRYSIVDDDAAMRRMFGPDHEAMSGFVCAGCSASAAEALDGIPDLPGDVVLMDIRVNNQIVIPR